MIGKRIRAGCLILAVAAGAFVLAGLLGVWPPEWWCSKEEINIKTGQVKQSHYLLFLRTSEQIEETPLSRLLSQPIEKAEIESWHTVTTFSPPFNRVSPHYHFHGATVQAWDVDVIFGMTKPPGAEKREIAVRVLELWQTTGNDSAAGEYIDGLFEKAAKKLGP